MVRQEFIPTDVDEAEFQLQVTAPEGTSTAAMDDILRAIDRDVRRIAGVRTVLATTGGGNLVVVNSGSAYVRIAPHAERIFSFTRLLTGLVTLDPMAAFRGNYSQRDVMRQIRTALRAYPELRTAVRNIQSFNIGGGNTEFEFVIRGPELARLSEYGEALRSRAPELGLLDADVTLKIDKPELRVMIDRARAADLGVSTADIGAALRVMVGGIRRSAASATRPSTRSTTSSCGSTSGFGTIPPSSSVSTSPAAMASWCGSTAWSRS